MAKIGIITFHWATNFGAVLQAYALQRYLQSLGQEVLIINYKPVNYEYSVVKSILNRTPFSSFISWKKEKGLISFRNRLFNCSKNYASLNELKKNPPICDIYITGSDQVWNPYFLLGGEGKITTTYFLTFVPEGSRKCAYAVSFGTNEYSNDIKNILSPIINSFNVISVRERTGLDIVSSLKYEGKCELVPDPTLLLKNNDYTFLFSHINRSHEDYIYVYILRNKQILKCIENELRRKQIEYKISPSSDGRLDEWLYSIMKARFVITNSYHGMLFCLQFHVPFFVLTEEGDLEGMNDRFYTVLRMLDLEKLIYNSVSIIDLNRIVSTQIDWGDVDRKLDNYRKKGYDFIQNLILNGN